MSSELSGRGYETGWPGEVGTEAEHPDARYVPSTAGENPVMSLDELYARRDQQAAAGRDETVNAVTETAGHGEGTAAGNDGGSSGNHGTPDGRSGTGQENRTAPEGPDAGASTVAPALDTGRPAGTSAPDAGEGGTGPDEGGGGEGTSVGTPVPDPTPGPDSATVPGDAGGNGEQRPEPAGDPGAVPGPGMPGANGFRDGPGAGAGADGFRDRPGAGAAVAGDGGEEGAPGGPENGNPDGVFGRGGDGQDAHAAESGDQGGGESTPSNSRTGTEALEQARRAEGTADGESADRQDGGTSERKPKDQPPLQNPEREAGTDQAGEASSEVTPDQSADDQRWTAIEQRMQATLDSMKADYEAKSDAQKADYEAKLDAQKADYDAKLDAQEAAYEAKLDSVRSEYAARIGDLESQRDAERTQTGRDDRSQQADTTEEEQVPAKPDVVQRGERDEQPQAHDEGQPYWQGSKQSQEHKRSETPEPQTDRPGWFSNAKLQLYSTVASGVFAAGAVEYLHGLSPVAAGIIGAAVVAVGNLIPVIRERSRKSGHGK